MEYIPKTWNSIYPLYFDKAYSKNNGRKTDIANSCDNPTIEEISQVLALLKIPHGIEPHKRHPCDYFRFGRIKYSLVNENKQLVNPDVPSKVVLYKKIGSMVLKLKLKNDEQGAGQKHYGRGRNR